MVSWHFRQVLPSTVLLLGFLLLCICQGVFIRIFPSNNQRLSESLLPGGRMLRHRHSVSSVYRRLHISSFHQLSPLNLNQHRGSAESISDGAMLLKFLRRSNHREGKWKLPAYNYGLWAETCPKCRIIVLPTCCCSDLGSLVQSRPGSRWLTGAIGRESALPVMLYPLEYPMFSLYCLSSASLHFISFLVL